MTTPISRLSTALPDRYVIERELGAGGMATVYLARDVKHERDVALKVLRPELGAVLGSDRFLAEIRISARLDHPHILTLIDSGESDGLLWYVMPFVRGESLREKLTRERQLGLDESLAIVRQVASALSYAHRQGVVHRDIKPENILLQEGEAMLADFGIALAVKEAGGNRLTETGLSLGTPQYMSPEQATGDRTLDARSDVYSLGAVLYEMLSGEPPVTGATVQAMIAKLLTERPTPLRIVRDTVPVEIESAVTKALSKVPADRFASASDFAAALDVSSHTALASPTRAPAWWRYAIASLLVVVIVLAVLQWRSGPDQPFSDVASVAPTQLTFTGNTGVPVVSADGLGLAYEQHDCTPTGACTSALVVRDLAGAGTTQPLNGFKSIISMTWSPDGRSLLIVGTSPDRRFGWHLVPALGGAAPRFLGTSEYLNFIGSGDSLFTANSNEDGSMRLAVLTTRDARERDTMRVRVPGFALRRVSISPNGKWLGLVGRRTGDGGSLLFIADRQGVVHDSVPARGLDWDPGGRLYVSRSDSLDPRLTLVRRFDVDDRGKLSRRSVLVLSPIEVVEWGASRLGIVYSAGPTISVVYAATRTSATSDRMTLRRLATSTGELAGSLSPLGDRLALLTSDAGVDRARYRWYTMPFDSGARTPLSPPIMRPSAFDWTVDGAHFAYVARDGARMSVVHVDVPSGRSRVLAERGDTSEPRAFLPLRSGGFVLAPNGMNGFMETYDASGAEARKLLTEVSVSGLAESPDGGRVALWGWNMLTSDTVTFASYTSSTGAVKRVAGGAFEGASGLHWLGDGVFEVALFETAYSGAVYHVDINTGGIKRVADIPVPYVANVSFSNDGRRLVINAAEPRTDVWLARVKQ